MTELEKVLERVRSRCRVEDPNDPDSCWVWATRTVRGQVRVTHQGEKWPVRRLLAHLMGLRLTRGRYAIDVPKCGNPACLAPHHIRTTTMEAHLRRTRTGKKMDLIGRRNTAAAARRRASTLTPEQVAAIRSSSLPASHFARLYGKTASAVTAIRRGETHRDYEPNPWQGLL